MTPWRRCVLVGIAALTLTTALPALEACEERILTLRFSPPVGRANNWCWAASGQMIMELLGGPSSQACQCRQAEQVLGVKGCCLTSSSCLPAEELPAGCDRPRWPAFVEKPDRYRFAYATSCDDLPGRQDDEGCAGRPLAWVKLTAELCAGRPVIAALRPAGSTRGHTVIVKGFSTRPDRRVLVVDPSRVCPAGRDCEGELDEGFWLPYAEFAAGWDGMVHWVDFYGIRKDEARETRAARAENGRPRPSNGEPVRTRRRRPAA